MRRYQAAVPETLRSLSVSLGRTFGSVQTKVPLTNRNSDPYLILTLTLALTLALALAPTLGAQPTPNPNPNPLPQAQPQP